MHIDTEQMQRAANTFDNAAEQMRRTIEQFDHVADRLERLLGGGQDNHIERMIERLEEAPRPIEPPNTVEYVRLPPRKPRDYLPILAALLATALLLCVTIYFKGQ